MPGAWHLVIRGMVPRAYYEKQKKAGFLLDETAVPAVRIPLNEKRLLSLDEFCGYAGGIGICTTRKHVREIGAEVRIGGRCLVDRIVTAHRGEKIVLWLPDWPIFGQKALRRNFIIETLKMAGWAN